MPISAFGYGLHCLSGCSVFRCFGGFHCMCFMWLQWQVCIHLYSYTVSYTIHTLWVIQQQIHALYEWRRAVARRGMEGGEDGGGGVAGGGGGGGGLNHCTPTIPNHLFLFQAREAAKPKVEAKVIEEEIVHEDNEWGKRTFDLSVIFWIYIVM